MTAREESKLNMYDAVVTFGTVPANATIIFTVPAFDALFTILKAKLSTLKGIVAFENQVITGIATDKKVLKVTLCDMACNIAAVVSAYAVSINNNELKEAMSLQPSECKATEDGEVEGKCQNIHDGANAHIAALATYGITAGMLSTLQDTIDDYAAKVAGPRNAISNRAAKKTARKNLFKEIDSLLKTQMDKIAVQFKAANIGFYNEYFQNRILVDAPTSKTGIKGPIKDSVTNLPITVIATLVLQSTAFTVNSDASGNFKFIKIPNGTYNIIITAPGYQNKQITNVTVTQGQMTTINITLTPA